MFEVSVGRRSTKKWLAAAVVGTVVATGGMYSAMSPASAAAEQCATLQGDTGNVVYDAMQCDGESYVPDVAGADAESQEIAFGIYKSILRYCVAYPTLGDLRAIGFDEGRESDGTHHFNPTNGKDPSTTEEFMNFTVPYTAMISGGDDDGARNGGIMSYQDSGFPYIGSIPRTHRHTDEGGSNSNEMFHAWCQPTIEEAFYYDESNVDNVPSVEVLQDALNRAETGGIAAVSSQLAGGAGQAAGVAVTGGAQPSRSAGVGTSSDAMGSTAPAVGSNSTVGGNVPWARTASSQGTAAVPQASGSSLRQQVMSRLDSMSEDELADLLAMLESGSGSGSASSGGGTSTSASSGSQADHAEDDGHADDGHDDDGHDDEGHEDDDH